VRHHDALALEVLELPDVRISRDQEYRSDLMQGSCHTPVAITLFGQTREVRGCQNQVVFALVGAFVEAEIVGCCDQDRRATKAFGNIVLERGM
jgi:hypothetical protein